VLHTAILVQPEFTDDIIKACCVLHNFVRKWDGYKFEDTLSNNLDEFQMNGTAGARQEAIIVREYFADYFVNAGSIHFQQRYM